MHLKTVISEEQSLLNLKSPKKEKYIKILKIRKVISKIIFKVLEVCAILTNKTNLSNNFKTIQIQKELVQKGNKVQCQMGL